VNSLAGRLGFKLNAIGISKSELYRRLYAGLVNFMVGDALGAPIELLHYKHIDRIYGRYGVRGLVKPIPSHPARSLKPWSVTDDTEGLLLTVNIILKYGKPKLNDYVRELVTWAKRAKVLSKYYYGLDTKYAIEKLLHGASIDEAGAKGECCGGPVRSLPAGLVNPLNPKRAAEEAILYCKVTHSTSVALSAAAAIAAFTSLLYSGDIDLALKSALKYARWAASRGRLISSPSVSERIKLAVRIMRKTKNPYKGARKLHDIIGIGLHSSEAIPIAIGIFYRVPIDPTKAIHIALNMGGDTDTIAALVGLLTGVFSGKTVNTEYIENVLKTNKIDIKGIVNKLVDLIIERDKY